MTPNNIEICPWFERVSAHVDGELPADQVNLVQAHVKTCALCSQVAGMDFRSDLSTERSVTYSEVEAVQSFQIQIPKVMRILLALIGSLIILSSAPDFIRGSTSGNALHDLRHLAIWQAAVGCTVIAASITSRLSRLIVVLITTFLALTATAVLYDLFTGHRGPWTDIGHVIEVVALLLLLVIAMPYLRLALARLIPRSKSDSRTLEKQLGS